jgi:hypothetical protein
MAAIGSVGSSGVQTAQAVAAAQANVVAEVDQTKTTPAGLPPVNLAQAASANAVNAELVSSQWGIDPTTVGSVYGGAGESGGLFAGDTLLPLLTNLTHANAEQALSLIGVKTPPPGTAKSPSSGAPASASSSAPTQLAQAQAASTPSGPMMVDPLWGRSA